MRKSRRLTHDELAPYVWEMPRDAAPPAGPPPAAAAPPPAPIDWAALFGNARPVELEVGMGKGLFLLNQAVARPAVNFFGVEIVRKYQLYAATRLAVRGLTNARTSCADAKRLLREFVTPGSVSVVHVLFPDPWWKKRHRKRRVFTPEFAADAARAIAAGGRLHVESDVEEYFGVMTGIVRAMPAFREPPPPAANEPSHDMDYLTNFERKARKKGMPIYRSLFERTAEAVTIAPDPADDGADDADDPGGDETAAG